MPELLQEIVEIKLRGVVIEGMYDLVVLSANVEGADKLL